MTTNVSAHGWVCEVLVDGKSCRRPAIRFHDQPQDGTVSPYLCVDHLVEAVRDGRIQVFLPAEIEAAEKKVEDVLNRVNDIERLCATCGAEVNDSSHEPEDAAFEVSW